jgi:transcriptional regulator with XRE-family HTH domain
MKRGGLSKSEMAKRMGTSRGQLDRLLDPKKQYSISRLFKGPP